MLDCGMGPDTDMLAICWDGTGYGDDGTLWGGEFLACSWRDYRRLAYFRPLPLPGGEKAILEPRRVALGWLFQLYGADALHLTSPVLDALGEGPARILFQLQQKKLHAPLSSSVGRLFDAAAALLGICQVMSYEGESGLRMENYYDPADHGSYAFNYEDGVIDCSPAVIAMLTETEPQRGVTRFINMLVEIIITVMHKQQRSEALICGGVFQNRRLLEKLLRRARAEGLRIHVPAKIPVNDGSIALGQIAAAVYDETHPGR